MRRPVSPSRRRCAAAGASAFALALAGRPASGSTAAPARVISVGGGLTEIVYAIGLWCGPTQRLVARVGLVGWPLVGLLAGEPFWGLAMALFALPLAVRR
jgi:hypothetical protein